MAVYLGVDLAARYTAAALLDEDADLIWTWTVDVGAAHVPPKPQAHLDALHDFWRELCKAIDTAVVEGHETVVGLEDIYPHAVNAIPGIRLSGAFLAMAWASGVDDVLLVSPLVWQRHYGYRKQHGRTSKGWAKGLVAELGYDVSQWHGKEAVDVRDAILIARYLRDTWSHDVVSDPTGVPGEG